MAVGIVIALLQALTQVQEITLTFIPKIIAMLLVTSLMAPFIGTVIYAFAEQVYGRIQNGFYRRQAGISRKLRPSFSPVLVLGGGYGCN